jgi:hypothetical protein
VTPRVELIRLEDGDNSRTIVSLNGSTNLPSLDNLKEFIEAVYLQGAVDGQKALKQTINSILKV